MEGNRNNSEKQSNKNIDNSRRKALKNIVTYSALGAFALSSYKSRSFEKLISKSIFEDENSFSEPAFSKAPVYTEQLRIGIIGTGGRGMALLQGLGFVPAKTVNFWKHSGKKSRHDKRYENFVNQEDLNIVVNGVCDVYDMNAKRGLEAAANINRTFDKNKVDFNPKRYKTYKELLAADDIDAVIIATPDHWHAQMIIDAANAGKHVYSEKPMTWGVEEAYKVREAVKNNGITYQLGHQNRQLESYAYARRAYQKGLIGKPNLIEITTNRNSPVGAWVYPIPKSANKNNIDWQQFLGSAPKHDFNLERFFRWRCWWDYSSGLPGDLFTHDFDAMNQIMDLGIPESAVASGGIYFYKDGRDVPDVLQMAYEYPDRDLSMLYSASLASNKQRGRVIMGHDGYMVVGNNLKIFADSGSTKYKEQIKNGEIDLNKPIFTFEPGSRKNKHLVDAVTSPTEKYFEDRGLLYTYKNGKQYDTTFLHLRDWINAIRTGGETACNVDRGFEEAITYQMGTIAYRQNKKVYWDKEKG